MLFVQTTLADLDRLDRERLFCLTQSNDKSACEIVFSSSQKYGCSVGWDVCVCVCVSV